MGLIGAGVEWQARLGRWMRWGEDDKEGWFRGSLDVCVKYCGDCLLFVRMQCFLQYLIGGVASASAESCLVWEMLALRSLCARCLPSLGVYRRHVWSFLNCSTSFKSSRIKHSFVFIRICGVDARGFS
jgi:hypothetical protein